MTCRSLLLLGFLAAFLIAPRAVDARQAVTGDRGDALAQRLVTEIAHIQEGDIVRITGGPRDIELLEDIAVAVRARGAFPLITLNSDRLARRMFDDVAERYDSQTPSFELALAGIADAEINVDFGENPGAELAGVPAHRQATADSAATAVASVLTARRVRQINLGNGLYPTETLARQFGISQESLAEMFWAGLDVDYATLRRRGERVMSAFESGSELHITNPNGTDLRMRIEGQPVFLSDGVVSPEEVETGGAARLTWLPAGEVYTTPVSGTGEGTLVVDKLYFQGQEIRGLRMTFEEGRVTSMTADAGLSPLEALYNASEGGKELLAFVDIGVNPNVTIPPGSGVLTFVADGIVSVGIGNNVWAGGDNDVTFGLTCHLTGSTLEIDGRTLVAGGELQL